MDYLDILRTTNLDFHSLSKTEIIEKLEDKNNKIPLVNEVKNFIFGNNLEPRLEVVFVYLSDKNIELHAIDDHLAEQICNLLFIPVVSGDCIFTKINFTNLRFKERITNVYVYNKGMKEHTYRKILSLSHVILEKLKKVICIKPSSNKEIDFSNIHPDYNNFFISYDNKNTNNYKSNCGDLQIIQGDNSYLVTDSTADVDYSWQMTNWCGLKKYLRYDITCGIFCSPYKIKEIKDFKITYDKYYDKFDSFSPKHKLYLLKYENKHMQMYKKLKENLTKKCMRSIQAYEIEDDKISRYYYETENEKDLKNYTVAYDYINKNIPKEESQTVFSSIEYTAYTNKLKTIIDNPENEVFYVFDLEKAFYSIDLKKLDESIVKYLLTVIPPDHDIFIFFNLLIRFVYKISHIIERKDLPITLFSQFIFKLYMLSIFKDIKKKNYLIYVDDFIIYGKRDEIEKDFEIIINRLRQHKFNLSTFDIHDKLFNNSLYILKKEFMFSEDKEIIYQNFKNEIDNKSNLQLFLSVNCIDNETSEVENLTNDTKLLNISSKRVVNIISEMDKDDIHFSDAIVNSDPNICDICYFNEKNMCIVPCGHLICSECLSKINKENCPYCNKPFERNIKIYK